MASTGTGSFLLIPDYGLEGGLQGANDLKANRGRLLVEMGPAAAVPGVGAHVLVTGALGTDENGLRRFAPAFAVVVLASPVPLVPPDVLRTRALWDEIRVSWPGVPPAIVLESGQPGLQASASVTPDGIAQVLIRPGGDPAAHTIWHEAGHALHAMALRSRGMTAAFFSPDDPMGLAYYDARRLPGTWADSLRASTWGSIGYEQLAESFAALNLGDAELSITNGVPFEASRIRLFFVTWSPAG